MRASFLFVARRRAITFASAEVSMLEGVNRFTFGRGAAPHPSLSELALPSSDEDGPPRARSARQTRGAGRDEPHLLGVVHHRGGAASIDATRATHPIDRDVSLGERRAPPPFPRARRAEKR